MNSLNQNEIGKISNEYLLQRLTKFVQSERKLMDVILTYIHEVETRRLHLDLGYDSIFKFLTAHLGYSEDAAYARMHAARLLANIPELKAKLECGSILLTQIAKVCSAIRAEKKAGRVLTTQETLALLKKLENKNLLETRKTIAVELNQPVVEAQSVKPQSDDSFLIQVTLNKTQYEAFQKARDLISHSVPDNSIADAIAFLSNVLIKKVEGSNSESNRQKTADRRDANQPGEEKPSSKAPRKNQTRGFRINPRRRRYISIYVRRQLMVEANGCCTFEHPETGIQCDSRYQLQPDHIIPFAEGGIDDISNLRIMCGIHNRDRNRKRYGHGRALNNYIGKTICTPD